MTHPTLADGTPIAVNPFHIFAVKPMGAGSMVMAPGGAMVVVTETVEEVNRAVKRWVKGGEKGIEARRR